MGYGHGVLKPGKKSKISIIAIVRKLLGTVTVMSKYEIELKNDSEGEPNVFEMYGTVLAENHMNFSVARYFVEICHAQTKRKK